MDIKQIEEMILSVHTRSVKSYMRRQFLESQRQQIQFQIAQNEQELLKLDGELISLENLKGIIDKEEQK